MLTAASPAGRPYSRTQFEREFAAITNQVLSYHSSRKGTLRFIAAVSPPNLSCAQMLSIEPRRCPCYTC